MRYEQRHALDPRRLGPLAYPQAVGYAIISPVAQVGRTVTKHEAGDTVGIGCQSNSCGGCGRCLNGRDQYCLAGNIQTYNGIDPADGTITLVTTRRKLSRTRTLS